VGSLKICKVSYFGELYQYESPELNDGFNLIVGDNGSGKTTITLFIEYGLGGNVEVFKENKNKKTKTEAKREYLQVLQDKNNYVELEVEINNIKYVLKRFIKDNEIFIHDGNCSISRKIIRRNGNETFSDWILDKLDIEVFELSLGRHAWLIDFESLYRLINYDQYTENNRMYKSPNSYNFITDSLIIRKSIFETLLGRVSEEYNKCYSACREKDLQYNKISSELSSLIKLNSLHYNENFDIELSTQENTKISDKLEDLKERRKFLSNDDGSSYSDRQVVDDIENEVLTNSIKINDILIRIKNSEYELERVCEYKNNLFFEVEQLQKIMFTHEEIKMFDQSACPLCKSEQIGIEHESEGNYNSYNFIYSIEDYRKIYKQKSKKIDTIDDAVADINSDISNGTFELQSLKNKNLLLNNRLKQAINNSTYHKDIMLFEDLNNQINSLNDELYDKEKYHSVNLEIHNLKKEKEKEKHDKEIMDKKLSKSERNFNKDNENTIEEFNSIFTNLIEKSPLGASTATIDDDYMPLIDGGIYKEKSSGVMIRLVYYFTFLIYSLQNNSVKFPRLLIIDTPEDAGIDSDKLVKTLSLFEKALSSFNHNQYQVIITTGENRYPESHKKYIREKFCKKNGNYILRKKDTLLLSS